MSAPGAGPEPLLCTPAWGRSGAGVVLDAPGDHEPAALGGAGLDPGAQRDMQALAGLAAPHEPDGERPLAGVLRPEPCGVVPVAVAQQAIGPGRGVAERARDELGRAQQAGRRRVLALLARQALRVARVRAGSVDRDAELAA